MPLMPDSSNSYVTRADFQNEVMVFSVQLEGFNVGEAVELSGSATQNNGALASFYGIQTVPALNPQGLAELTLSAAPSAPFREGEDVTVVLRAAKVWVTVLGEDPDERSQVGGAEAGQAQDGTAWPKVKRETAIRGYAPPAPPAGQAPSGGQAGPVA
jgi:hypothetical protein